MRRASPCAAIPGRLRIAACSHKRSQLGRGRPTQTSPLLPAMDLYIAARSDRSDILKIGRSDDEPRRCRQVGQRHRCTVTPLVTFHNKGEWERRVHDVLRHRMVRIGHEREWFRASLSDAIAVVSLVIHDPPAPMINADRLLQSIQPVRTASKGSTASDIEDLASTLYGDDWKHAIVAGGLKRKRTQKFEGAVRVPAYKYVYPDGRFSP